MQRISEFGTLDMSTKGQVCLPVTQSHSSSYSVFYNWSLVLLTIIVLMLRRWDFKIFCSILCFSVDLCLDKRIIASCKAGQKWCAGKVRSGPGGCLYRDNRRWFHDKGLGPLHEEHQGVSFIGDFNLYVQSSLVGSRILFWAPHRYNIRDLLICLIHGATMCGYMKLSDEHTSL